MQSGRGISVDAQSKKRKREDDEEVDEELQSSARRQKQRDGPDLDDLDLGDLDGLDADAIDQIVDQAPEMEALDSAGVRKILVAFEKAYSKNQEMRVKHSDDPTRFIDSEVDLDEQIKKLSTLATSPDVYNDFIGAKSHLSLLSLVSHENPDISVDAIDVIKELIDGDVFEENNDAVLALVDSLLENQLLEVLMQNLKRFDELSADERSGVYNTLSVIENLAEVKPDQICDDLLDKTDFLAWILKRLQSKKFDDVKQYASEILSILAQTSKRFQIAVGAQNGIEILLTVVAQYKKINPESVDEEELIENIINTLCLLAPLPENRPFFVQAEGLQLIRILIKNKKYCRKCGLKLLDFVLTNDPDNCKRWVDVGGLGALFGSFMKKGANKHKKGYDELRDDEHVISSLASLLNGFASEPSFMKRVVLKFHEKNFEKIERLVDLHSQYISRTKKIEAEIETEKEQLQEEGVEITEAEEEEFYMRLLDAEDATVREKTEAMMKLNDLSFDDVKKTLLRYAKSLGDSDSDAQVQQRRQKILDLANGL